MCIGLRLLKWRTGLRNSMHAFITNCGLNETHVLKVLPLWLAHHDTRKHGAVSWMNTPSLQHLIIAPRKELRCLLFQMKNCQVMVAQNGSYAEEVGAEGSRVRGQPGLSFRAGKMAKLLRCAVFPEDRNSVPSNHVRRLVTTCPSISKASTPSFVLHIHIEDSCTGTYMYHN